MYHIDSDWSDLTGLLKKMQPVESEFRGWEMEEHYLIPFFLGSGMLFRMIMETFAWVIIEWVIAISEGITIHE